MGLDWILIDHPVPGREADFYRLGSQVEEALHDPPGDHPTAVGPRARALIRQLQAITITPEDTWRRFLAERWRAFQNTVDAATLPAGDAALAALSWESLQESLERRFPRFAHDRYAFLHALIGDPARARSPWTTRRLTILWDGWDDGFIWRRIPAGIAEVRLWSEIDHDSGAESARINAGRLTASASATLRRMLPALAALDDDAIVARVDAWGEWFWSRRQGRYGGAAPPDGQEELARNAAQVYAIATWLAFWGERGHGFVRSA